MSAEYKDQDVRSIAQATERDLNPHSTSHGDNESDTGSLISPPNVNACFTDSLSQYLNLVWMQQ